jgi:hypothetical protein
MKVKDELGIIWNTGAGQMESPGIEFFGLFPSPATQMIVDPKLFGWLGSGFEVRVDRIQTNAYSVLCISVRIGHWPDDRTWRAHVEKTLAELVACGAIAAWSGGYDCTWSPEVLNPAGNTGNVYAAYSKATGFVCNAELHDEMRFLNDAQLAALWQVVAVV